MTSALIYKVRLFRWNEPELFPSSEQTRTHSSIENFIFCRRSRFFVTFINLKHLFLFSFSKPNKKGWSSQTATVASPGVGQKSERREIFTEIGRHWTEFAPRCLGRNKRPVPRSSWPVKVAALIKNVPWRSSAKKSGVSLGRSSAYDCVSGQDNYARVGRSRVRRCL